MYKATTKNNLITENTTILADGFSSLFFKNTGADNVNINGNILIAPGSSFSFDNLPYVQIDEHTQVIFEGIAVQKLLVIKTYFQKVM